MAEPLPGPVPQVFDGLGGGGVIQPAQQVITANDAHDLDVNNVRRSVIRVSCQPPANALGQGGVGYHLVETGRVND